MPEALTKDILLRKIRNTALSPDKMARIGAILDEQAETHEAVEGTGVLEGQSEAQLEALALAKLQADFQRGIRLIKTDGSLMPEPADLTWETVQARLLAEGNAGLKKAAAMQGGGELFGVDEQGRLLIKDRGNEPVMFGFDKDGKPVMIYDRNTAQLAKVTKWANYWEVYEAVYGPEGKPTGYEFFPYVPVNEDWGGAIPAVEDVTKASFVTSPGRRQSRSSWLDNGRDPNKRLTEAQYVFYSLSCQMTCVRFGDPKHDNRGAIRLLRV